MTEHQLMFVAHLLFYFHFNFISISNHKTNLAMFNPGDIMGKIQEMQAKIRDAQAKMDNVTVESEAGGGMVRVRANANRKVLKIEIDPTIVDKEDTEFMSDLIAAAVNKALEKAEARGKEEMQKATDCIMPNIPGLNLGGL